MDFILSDLIGAVENEGTESWHEKLTQMENGKSLPVDFEMTSREGMFDNRLQYAVYERADVEQLIKRLQGTLK